MMLLFYSFSEGQNLLHYWNFNNNASVSAITAATQSNIVGSSLTANLSGITAIDFAGGTAQNFNVLNLNARNADAFGTHLRFNDPIGSSLVFSLPTTGYENAIVKFATRRSAQGAGTQVWSYSTDGTTYTFFVNVLPNNGDPGLATLDFSSISAADNNPNFKLKVVFLQGAGGTSGNNRFDNFTAEGTLLSASDTTAPTVSFSPSNSATNVVRNVNPTIAFNESVRLLNNDAITNTTVDAVVELRLNNASGTLVPFDATFASNTITIVPTTLLNVNQVYYVALLPNTIEDVSNNAVTTLQSTVFTTAKPIVTLSVSANTGTEAGTTSITVSATADVAVSGDQTVNIGVTGTSITAGDYSLSNSVITILNGQTTGSVTFTVIDDTLLESIETATLTISNPSSGLTLGATLTQNVVITDNDLATNPLVTISVSTNTGTEAGTTAIIITATANAAVSADQTLNLGVSGINITAGDYSLSNSVITILNGQTTSSVTFTVVDDALVEGSEIAALVISNPSSGLTLGSTTSQNITITDNDVAPNLNIDLSTYVRVGRYDLPEPTRTAHPANNLLCQEASAVTYNWDTDTLFITGDGSTSITQVSKTGQLIDTMTMAQGSSPQGTDFYDTEGLTYIGNGQFVMSEERDRQLVKFTYAAGTTLSRANTQTVKIGTFVPNTGTEGLSYDPLTGGYIVLKEITPIGIFQTGVDFNAGTATNGSATTENSTNLFDPALLGFSDVADVFALSNIPALNGQSLYNNLLVLGQENAKVVNVDQSGVIVNSLTIVSDAGNPLDVASQQHEGLTMDRDGRLYIVSENGGGTIDYPQLWVYAASTVPNQAPTAIALTNTTTAILENSNTTAAVKVADITVTDDGLGTNNLTLSGADANSFQITGSSLFIKAGTVIDFETKTSYNVTINVDDTTIGSTPDASVNFVLSVTDVLVETTPIVSVSITEAASWSSSTTNVGADWFEVTNNGNAPLDITGWKVDDSSNSFTAALSLTGITSIASGESVIFLETTSTNAATIIANFKSAWFGSNVPAGLQVGSYTGGAIGLSTGGDAVNLFNAAGVVQSNISFGTATTNFTFNNAASLTNSVITTLSQVGVNDAFAAANDTVQIGSPGTIGKLFISEVAPWSSGNSPVGADWFEVTNTKAVAVDITGWKVDDNSQSPAAAVALNGITSINPGESVIFMETADLAGKTTAFINNWFGTNPSSGLRIGNYTGTGIGFGTGGDQVNLYNGLSSTPVSSVLFGASPATAPFTTFDNAIGQNSLVTPITQFSAVGTKGAFIAANSATEIGSPGTFVTAPCPTITATATPFASSVCLGATTTVSVIASGGTLPYIVTGSPLTVGGGTFNYTITDAKGCTATATTTVISLPAATVNLSVSTNTASETKGTVVTVTATTSAALCFDETIAVDVTGTGITAADYTLSNAPITIPAGSTTGSVTFTVVSDNAVEAGETAVVTISNPSSGLALGTTTTQNIAISDFAFTLQVLHASDFEGAVEAVQDAPRFAAIVDQLEESYVNTIKLSSGDNYIPGPFLSSGEDSSLSAALKTSYESYYNTTFSSSSVSLLPSIGRADISILNFIGIEASALGNHEFDLGTTEVRNIIRGANNTAATTRTWFGAQFPYLSSNLNFSGDSNLSAIATTDRLRLNTSFMSNPTEAVTAITNKSKLAPSTIIMKGGQKIGIVGCTTQVLASISSPGATTVVGGGANDMMILAGIVQPVVNSLIAEGCNKIILLSHLQQIAFEKELAGKLTGVDIIMAGGSNTLMADADDRLRAGDVAYESYPFLTTGLDGKALALINTDGNYKYVGRLVVDFDVDGTLIPSSINSLVSGVYAADAQGLNDVWGANVANAYAVGTRGYQVQLLCNAIGNVIIAKDGNLFGKTSIFLEGRRNFVRTEETNIGNVSAEANLWLAKFYDPTTVISIKNGGGIRSAIGNVIAVGNDVTYAPPIANPSAGKQSGDISQLDIENSLRFNNQLSLVTLTASGLRLVLEHAVNATTATATPGQFAQVAGVRYSYNLSNASGSKILNAVITDEAGNIIDTLVVNGVTVGNLSRTFRVVTLNFLAGGGDSYPFNTLGTSRSDLNTLSEQGPAAASFTNAGSEQDAFAEYMKNQFSAIPYGITDTPLTQDCRIQRIPVRADNVLPPSAGSNGTVTICNDSTITAVQLFAALGGTPVAGGTWSPAITGAGIYTYTVTSPSCAGSASATVTVTEGSIIVATATPIASTVCTGATTTVSVTAIGGTSPYIITGSSLTAGAGTYNYIVTDAKGCSATTSVTITETAVSENVTNISACDSYTWNETTYTSSGLYTGTTTNCVTEKLNLIITPSSLIAEPTNPTICKLTGAIATTKVIAASGSTYKWYTQTASGTTWAALVNSANYVGIDEAELKITRTTTTVPANGTKYKVVVSNICGNVTSTTVALQEQTVLSKTAVVSVVGTLSPALTACQGGNVNLSLAAGSVGNIQWQSSTDGITYANVGASIAQSALSTNNLVMSFNTGDLTQTTWFRIVASNGVCSSVSSTAVKITVSSPVTTGSINGGGVTVCAPLATGIDANGNALTAAITNSTTITLSDYTVGATILWQKSTNYVNSTNASPVWASAGSTTNTFTASALTLDTWYRAQVTNGACKDFTVPVKIAVSPSAKAGVITSDATVCTGGDITFTSAAYTGTLIQWEVSTTSATTGFQTVSGENELAFIMNAVAYAPLSKFYVRNVVTSGICTLARSAVKTITVNPLSVSGTVKGGGTICSGSNRTLLVAGNTGTIQWQSSTNGTDFVNVPSIVGTAGVNYASGSATGIAATYIVSNITADTYFRAKITSGLCSVAYSNVVEYNIGTTAVSGVVSALSSTICPATGTTLTLGNSAGSVQWQKATISATTGLPGTFANITNQTGTTLATGNLTASTAYQAIVTIGSCSSVTTSYVSVFVVTKPTAKSITSNVTSPAGGLTTPLCTNDPKKTLTIGAGYTGAIQWQSSTVSSTKGFADIDGANSVSYIVASPSSGANFYRATFTNTCGVIAISTPVTIYFTNCSSSARVAAKTEEVEMTFNVFAYPNSYSDNFKLSLESPSNDKVNVAVFDLSGKLIEKREINSNEINALDLGNNYPSGVLNVIVTQGTNIKTVRVVKQ